MINFGRTITKDIESDINEKYFSVYDIPICRNILLLFIDCHQGWLLHYVQIHISRNEWTRPIKIVVFQIIKTMYANIFVYSDLVNILWEYFSFIYFSLLIAFPNTSLVEMIVYWTCTSASTEHTHSTFIPHTVLCIDLTIYQEIRHVICVW